MSLIARKHACVLALALALAAATQQTAAQDVVSSDKYFTERLRGSSDVAALDPANLFGESISLKDGTVSFSQDDIAVPLNSGMRLAFGRQSPKRTLGKDYASMPLGLEWEFNVPYMVGRYDTRSGWVARNNGARCSSADRNPGESIGPAPDYNTRLMPARMYWNGVHINLPGAGYETLLSLTPEHLLPTDGVTYIGSARGDWRVSCLSALKKGSGEGFVVRLPTGEKYHFDWMATRDTPDVLSNEYYMDALGNGAASPYLLVPTTDVFLYATKVEDRFGNHVLYNYDSANPHRLTSIVSSEGPRVDIAYGANGKVSTARWGERTWTYRYATVGKYGDVLSEVVLPDQSAWKFSGDLQNWRALAFRLPNSFYMSECAENATGYRQGDPEQAAYTKTAVIQHPSGAVGTFKFRQLIHGSDNTPGGCSYFGTSTDLYFGSHGIPNAYVAFSLVSKKVAGPGVDLAWAYTYAPRWSFHRTCTTECVTSTTVLEPSGTTKLYRFGNSYTADYGDLLNESVLESGVVKKTTSYVRKGSTGDFPEFHGKPMTAAQDNPLQYKVRPVQKVEHEVDGVKFTRAINTFDAFARPTSVTRSSTPAN